MPRLVWDQVGDRVYESGLDRGVLYLRNGSATPWNGLISVAERFDKEVAPVYYDGVKIYDLVTLGDYTGSIKAYTYPDEFSQVEGADQLVSGVILRDQKPQTFGLCYRTSGGSDLGIPRYKIHILYNVTAVPRDRAYTTFSDTHEAVEFEWDISAVPEFVPGHRQTAQIVLDSRRINPWLLRDLEDILYGTPETEGRLPRIPELVDYISNWVPPQGQFTIVNNGDGTWTAYSEVSDDISMSTTDPGMFTLINANAVWLNQDEYQLYNSDVIP